MRIERRKFLKAFGAGMLATTALGQITESSSPDKPNILLIMTDQQFGDLMSCVIGDRYLRTPHMDSLAENGMRFSRAYSPNPLCMPMRTSMMTGRYPHQTGIQNNRKDPPRKFPMMGSLARPVIFLELSYEYHRHGAAAATWPTRGGIRQSAMPSRTRCRRSRSWRDCQTVR